MIETLTYNHKTEGSNHAFGIGREKRVKEREKGTLCGGTTFSITTLSITTFSMMTISIKGLFVRLSINYI